MRKKNKSVQVNTMFDDFDEGIAIETMSFENLSIWNDATLKEFEVAKQSHREDRHSFFLLEKEQFTLKLIFRNIKLTSPLSSMFIPIKYIVFWPWKMS